MGIIGQMCYNTVGINNVLATALTVPGREAGMSDLIAIVQPIPLSGYLTVKGVEMDNLEFISQGELFPEDSVFHSSRAKKSRHAKLILASSETEHTGGRPSADIVGQRFGLLTVVSLTNETFAKCRVYICRCDCGYEIKATAGNLRRKTVPLDHCGCLGVGRHKTSRPGSRGIGGFNSGLRRQKPSVEIALSGLLSSYRYGAAKRGYAWELSRSEFLKLTQGTCHYCGVEPSQVYRQKPHEYTYNGVDRLDSSKPYTLDNCVSCCGDCNKAKLDRPVDEFLDWIKKVYEFQTR